MSKRAYYEEILVRLSWKILEHKWRYYYGVRFGVQPIADEKYDKVEENYKKLIAVLNKSIKSGLLKKIETKYADESDERKAEIFKKHYARLKKNPTASSMVGFDFNRGSCKIVHMKMCQLYELNPTVE